MKMSIAQVAAEMIAQGYTNAQVVQRLTIAKADYVRFIEKEEKMGADNRPAHVQTILDQYIASRNEIEAVLATL